MTKKWKIAAVIVALSIMPAAVFVLHLPVSALLTLSMLAGAGMAGTVTFTYESFQYQGKFGGGFTGGSATAPTAAQAQQTQAMSALVGFTDTDTTFVFTHNWGLSAAEAAALLPQIIVNPVSGAGASAVYPILQANVTSNTNLVTFTKVNATGSGMTVSIWLRRAASISS